jgi:L-ascorbate metabolism protein UlaG (beta-lactamase superfamily)
MKITWVGHACFLIEAKEARVMTDPFHEDVPYRFLETTVDVVTVSHDHFDHNAIHRVPGRPAVIEATGVFDVHGLHLRGIPSFHDDCGGKERGPNILYTFALEGMTIAHLGDLGTPLDGEQREALADVDVLLVPVGGTYTIDARQAASLIESLPNVRLVIPMHFKTDAIADWPIATVDEFESLMDNARRVGASTVEVTRASLPEQREVWILDHA